MKCQKIRKTQNKFCVKDFYYAIKIIKKSTRKHALHGEYESYYDQVQTYDIMCYLEKKNVDFEVGGELAGSNVILEVICPYLNIYSDINANIKKYFIEFQNETYQIEHIEQSQLLTNRYLNIEAKRVAN
jgi:hypothetical protein